MFTFSFEVPIYELDVHLLYGAESDEDVLNYIASEDLPKPIDMPADVNDYGFTVHYDRAIVIHIHENALHQGTIAHECVHAAANYW